MDYHLMVHPPFTHTCLKFGPNGSAAGAAATALQPSMLTPFISAPLSWFPHAFIYVVLIGVAALPSV